MTKKEFCDSIRRWLIKTYPNSDIQFASTCTKTNEEDRYYIEIFKNDTKNTVSLDGLYRGLLSGVSFEKILEVFQRQVTLIQTVTDTPMSIDDFKSRLRGAVLSYDQFEDKYFEEKYGDIPHKKILDLAFFGELLYPSEKGEKITAKVSSWMLERFEMSEDKMFEIIAQNARKEKKMRLLSEFYAEIAGYVAANEMIDLADIAAVDIPKLYVLGNEDFYHGASMITQPDVLKWVYKELGEKAFYILPSSIHELMVIPKTEEAPGDPFYLQQMVSEINRDVVAPEEKLTDSVYSFDGKVLKREYPLSGMRVYMTGE